MSYIYAFSYLHQYHCSFSTLCLITYRGILGFVYQTDTGVGGCQFKDPIGAMERSGKFPGLALNIPGHVAHSITNMEVFQSRIMLLLLLLRLTDIVSSQLPGF